MKLADRAFAIKTIVGLSFLFLFASNVFASSIQGFVYDKQRNPMSNIDVELLNDYYQMIKRTRTDGAGRYNFEGLNDGRYTVRVLAFRYDLEDQEIPVEIYTQSIQSNPGSGSQITQGTGTFIQDFYLLPKKGGLKEAELSVVFAQEIPKEAKTIYDKAIKDLSDKKAEEGVKGLMEALKIFPDYYLALTRLGSELFVRGQYKEAVAVYLKATQVNQKSAVSYYYLGFSLYKLGKDYNKAALASLNKAAVLAPASPQVFWLLGKIERSMGNFADAEKHLLQAKKFSTSSNPEIHQELAQLYANDLKKYKEAADELELYMKAAKLSAEDEKKTKKIITDLREKAKTQTGS